jgi:hypothetical protein
MEEEETRRCGSSLPKMHLLFLLLLVSFQPGNPELISSHRCSLLSRPPIFTPGHVGNLQEIDIRPASRRSQLFLLGWKWNFVLAQVQDRGRGVRGRDFAALLPRVGAMWALIGLSGRNRLWLKSQISYSSQMLFVTCHSHAFELPFVQLSFGPLIYSVYAWDNANFPENWRERQRWEM